MSWPNRNMFQRLIHDETQKQVCYHSYLLFYAFNSWLYHWNTSFCNKLVMCHVKFNATHRFYMNIISYTRANNLMLIYTCL